jgi:hypothetical protein
MVAIAMLALLTVALFRLVLSSLQAVNAIDDDASRVQEKSNFGDVMRSALLNLPPASRFLGLPLSNDSRAPVALILLNAPDTLTWQPNLDVPSMVVLLQAQPAGFGWDISLKRFPAPAGLKVDRITPADLVKAGAQEPWLALLMNLKEVSVRFFDADSKEWKPTWTDRNRRPILVEMNLVYMEAPDLRDQHIFWIPVQQVEQPPVFQAAPAPPPPPKP